MDPVTISALIGAATAAVKGISGLAQRNTAKRLERENPRPTATMSPYIKELLGYSRGRALDQDIPGGDIYRDRIAGATASGIRAASAMGGGAEAFGALDRMVQSGQRNMTEMGIRAAQQRYDAQGQYMNVLQGPAYQEERRVDYWNREMPYLMAAQRASQLRDVGAQNIMSGIGDVAGIASSYAGYRSNEKLMSSLYGKGAGGSRDVTPEELNAILQSITGQRKAAPGVGGSSLYIPPFGTSVK